MLTLALACLAALAFAVPAHAAFGINGFDVSFTEEDGSPATQAGGHPFALTTSFNINYTGSGENAIPDGEIKDFFAQQIEGFVGDATAYPKCPTADFLARRPNSFIPECGDDTAVGITGAAVTLPKPGGEQAAVYNLVPPPGAAARLGFSILGVPLVIDVGVKQAPPYNILASVRNIPQVLKVFDATLQLWGNPASPAHDKFRGVCAASSAVEVQAFFTPRGPAGGCPTSAPEKPFLTLPTSCAGPLASSFEAVSWQEQGKPIFGSVLTHDGSEPPLPQGMTGCSKLGFSPAIGSQATTDQAETSSGLDFSIDFHDEGLTNPEGIAQSTIKKTVVTLPEGVTVNPSIAEGLGVCTPADLDREKLDTPAGKGCPNASKIGTVHVETPLLEDPIDGSVFLAQQDDPSTSQPGAENPFDSLIAFYIVLANPDNGVLVKVPAKVEPDPRTGQLVTTADDIPQLPFSHFTFHFREGQRAPLISPPACGTYTTRAALTPWARPTQPIETTAFFRVERGIGGGLCPPGGIPPFHPGFEAGSLNNSAKAFSPFYMRLTRADGEQDMTRFSSVLPPGVLGKLAGVSKCPDSAIAAAKAKTGRQELASPSCPANSKIGRTLAGAGVGGALTYVPGSIYLGGPFNGDPLSVIAITPAVAGPFDAGTVVVHEALTLNPETAEVQVDGGASDPIPHILKGIPLKVRDLRVYVDRGDFILNPTSCDPSEAKATLFGSYLNVLDPSDDRPADLATHFQAANCLNLGFKPKLSLKLNGGTKRGGHPALKAVLNARPNDANIGSAVVTLPTSAFLDQAHIRTICTRVQFAAKACPPGAQYGYARAFTPLLDEPLAGPVYLRSSNHKLPDLVAALHGIVDVNVVGRIDSFHGGIRSSFETVPDAPVSKFILTMQGGNKGLIVNSRNICSSKNRADALFVGQNGVPDHFHPLLKASCGKKHRR
jgi:hypothetical protein